MGVILFNGISSEDFGVQIAKPPIYQIPERDITSTLIPGRSGGAIVRVGGFKDVTREYEASFPAYSDFSERTAAIARWLFSSSGYAKLSDTYDPDVYRLAYCQSSIDVESLYQEAGRFTISFNCKPQRYLNQGSEPIIVTDNREVSLLNPTGMEAAPTIEIRGNGFVKLFFNDQTVSISNLTSEVLTIDCENEIAYVGSSLANDRIITPNGYPTLPAGVTKIKWIGDVTEFRIIPRWWSI